MIALAGNKCDLEENRQIPRDEAEEYAAENNVREIFEAIGHRLPKGAPAAEKADSFVIAAPQQNDKKKCDC